MSCLLVGPKSPQKPRPNRIASALRPPWTSKGTQETRHCFQDASKTHPTHLQDPQEASKTLPRCFQEAAKTSKNRSKHYHVCNFCFDFDFLRGLDYFVLRSTNSRPIKIIKNRLFLQLFRASAVYGLACIHIKHFV